MELFIIFLLTIINGIFSMSEIAVVSSRKVKLENSAKRGSKSAKLALELINSPNQFLSTVQIGITLIGILLGIFGGENLTNDWQDYLNQFEVLKPYSRPLSVGGVLVMITFISLVIGELVPKRIGLTNPEGIAKAVALPMQILSKVTSPFVWLLTHTSDLLLKILRIKPSADSRVTEEEIKAFIQEGTDGGEVQEIEQEIMERVFHLGDRKVGSLMTHRMQLVWLDLTDSPDEIREKIKGEIHSVYPVCRNTVDEVVGVVLMKDIFQQVMENRPLDLEALIKEPQYLPDSSSAYIALERLQENRQHYSMVIDEYGALQGIVTLNDLMDALVGDVSDTNYDDESSIVQREDGTYITDAQMPFYDFLSYFDQLDLYNDNMPFNTIGGLLLEHFGHVPKTGEIILWHGFKFEIFDMDGARIDKVLVTQEEGDSTEDA
ncbi:hemolysin family protein [Runella salmonicolor]|uniref:Hemolysin family protein n=1 Tax=Runella salmonicolor TaxID=2950278 RepID=A0ABT1FKS0_9BACT|nr:hemolysin family protein [Runella salmonicolor]MCP1382372.1 hemolysin family protein [Runella salmonicolor]